MKVLKCNINLALPADLSAYTNVRARSSTIYLIDETMVKPLCSLLPIIADTHIAAAKEVHKFSQTASSQHNNLVIAYNTIKL